MASTSGSDSSLSGSLLYTPDQDIRVHEEGAISLICSAFQSHENGLPEWVKNSADEYARLNAPEEQRAIFLIFDSGRGSSFPSISCLDFGGMTDEVIESSFRVWADPEAAARGTIEAPVQGGHGNGGKCYMTQMFEHYSLLHTVKHKRRCEYGVAARSVRFGYIPDPERGKNQPVDDVSRDLGSVLSPFRVNLELLERVAAPAVLSADGFTLVTGFGPKGYRQRIPVSQLIESLQSHPQMVQTLQFCRVHVIVNGSLYSNGRPLVLPEIPPLPGAEQPRVVEIPEHLKDPMSNQEVSTTADGRSQRGKLVLQTSDVSMRWRRKWRHTIIFKAGSGYIGSVAITELDVQSTYRDRIYGDCELVALEDFTQNDRRRLADSSLTRAVIHWIGRCVEEYAKEFEARDRRQHSQQARNAISRMNEALDRWKNRFLRTVFPGAWGAGNGPPPPPPPLPIGTPTRLELSLTYRMAGVGVSFRPTLKFFDENGRRIRPVLFRWVSDDNNVAMVDHDLAIVNTFSFGDTSICAETLDGRLKSNSVPLTVVHIHDIRVEPREIELAAGGRFKLDAICRLATGEETSGVLLVWTESNPSVARVSSAGLVFGYDLGETDVVAGDDRCLSRNPSHIRVVQGEGRGSGKQGGRGYPRILVSDIDADPDTSQSVTFSSDAPPIEQRPQDVERNIWWINSAAPLAQLYLSDAYGFDSREWRMYHLERYMDVMVQIAFTCGPEDAGDMSANEWILRWGSHVAEIQRHAASSLAEFIASGQLPEGKD